MLYKIEPRDAFNYIQFAHDQRTANIIGNSNYSSRITDDLDKGKFQIGQVPTPQTQDQRDQVERIVNLLNTKVSEGGKRKQKTNKKRRTNKKRKTQKKRKLYRK